MAAEGLSEIVPIPSRKCRPEPLLGLRWRRFSVLLFFCILIALLALTGLCLIQGLASLNSLPAHGLIPGSEMSKPVQVHIKTSLAASGDPENVQINYATFGSKSLHDLPERLTEVIKQQLHSDTNEATKENSGDAVASTTAVGTPTKATLKLKLKKTRQGFARVMVIASGERQYCASATGQQIQLFNLKTKQLYSTMQHYVFQNSTLHPNPQLKLGWNKIGVLQELLHRYTADEVSWFLWLEESAMFVDIHSPLPFEPTATVVDSSPATPQLQRVLLDIGVERAAGYTRAGQYVQVKVGDSKPGFFAIASPPDPNNQGVIELLIKNAGETATLLCTAAAGGEVDASPVMGKGFPIDKIPASSYSTVLMFATGSGISPIRALVESGQLQANDRAEVALYYGVKNSASAAYLDDIKQWESEGVKVVPVYSDEGKGYVQHVFEKEGVKPTDGSKVAAVLCGHKDMCTAITEILTGLGVEKDKILLNF